MKLNLKKDLIFFDVEATGLNVIRDRIVQLAMIKYFASGDPPEEQDYLINPGIPISEEAMGVHGITPKDVARKPVFAQVADEIFTFLGDADLAGYHSNQFDLPIVMEELARCGLELDLKGRRLIDVQRIFYKMEPRTLNAAHRFYCGSDIADAHNAMSDVKATVAVLQGQLERYDGVDLRTDDDEIIPTPVVPDVQALHDFTNDLRMVDATQKLRYNHQGQIVFNFGRYLGKPVAKTLYEDQQYYNWMLNKEFSFQVKQVIKELVRDYRKRVESADDAETR